MTNITNRAASATPAEPLVVYVDDEPGNGFVFTRKLGADFRIRSFLDPRAALDFIVVNRDVRLVVTDEVMPGLTGSQLADAVAQVRADVRFVQLSALPAQRSAEEAGALGGERYDAVLSKPFDFDARNEELVALFRDLQSRPPRHRALTAADPRPVASGHKQHFSAAPAVETPAPAIQKAPEPAPSAVLD